MEAQGILMAVCLQDVFCFLRKQLSNLDNLIIICDFFHCHIRTATVLFYTNITLFTKLGASTTIAANSSLL